MNPDDWQQQDDYYVPLYQKQKLSLWKRLGGGSLTIAILLHAVLLTIGAFFIIQRFSEPEKRVDFLPPAGGGGSKAASVKPKQNMIHKTAPRVVAIGSVGGFTLPEPEMSSGMDSLGDLVSSNGGLGGSGSGGGRGDGKGAGIGNGIGSGLGGGGMANPFGATEPQSGGLVGTFYDLKQSDRKKENELSKDSLATSQKAREIIRDYILKGFKESEFKDFYQASVKLYQTRILLPAMEATAAPAAFQCEKEVSPKRWVVVYRGQVKAPKTMKFRFVGVGDDCLVVRFNSRLVFDHGYTLASLARHLRGPKGGEFDKGYFSILAGNGGDRDLMREVKKNCPLEIPTTFYKYSSTRQVNEAINGYAVGPLCEVRQGQSYPIEILISEIPGGLFQASLMIQEEGVQYQKDSGTGAPILPLFRTDSGLPDPSKLKGAYAPFAREGPVFPVVKGEASLDGI